MTTPPGPGSRLLLDTHVFLWLAAGDPRIGETLRAELANGDLDLLLSVASVWEMAIKKSLGKLSLEVPLARLLEDQLAAMGVQLLDIGADHALAVEELAWHHRDPFDRLLVAQAIVDDLMIVSSDAVFDQYPVTRLWKDGSQAEI